MCMSAERDEGFNWHTLQRFIAGYRPPTKPVPARNGDLRAFAKKAGYKVVGVWKENRLRGKAGARRTQKRFTSRNGKNRTLGNGNRSKRSKFAAFHTPALTPDIIAREIDMFPAERR